MDKQISDKMRVFKVAFYIFLALDFIELIFSCITMIPTFIPTDESDTLFFIIAGIITAIIVVVIMFDILFKAIIIRSTSPSYSWTSGRKIFIVTAAILLILFNIGAVLLNLFAIGGEGATLLNQAYIFFRILASVGEAVTSILYLCALKKYFANLKKATNN